MQKAYKKIAILDDEESILNVLEIILNEAGYEVSTFSKPAKFLDVVNHEPFHLALIDIFIGSEDGGEICHSLKQTQQTKNLPVFLMSADNNIKKIALEAGADEYLEKPFDIDEVVKKVQHYVG